MIYCFLLKLYWNINWVLDVVKMRIKIESSEFLFFLAELIKSGLRCVSFVDATFSSLETL